MSTGFGQKGRQNQKVKEKLEGGGVGDLVGTFM